jgi:hypothetical protein
MAHCRNAQIRPRTQIRRRGITLLEVLISMFVALVGLAGLASLFWLGGVEMSEGAKIDRAMAVARAAQRTFKILGMHRPIQSYTTTSGGVTTTGLTQTWVALYGYSPTNAQFIDGSTPGGTISASTNPAAAALLAPTMPFAGAPPYYYYANANGGKFGIGNYTQGFAIDPIGVLANAAATPIPPSGFPPADPTGTTISVPPHGSDTTPCLVRVTLMSYPQTLVTPNTTPTLTTTSTLGQTYTAGQADLVFRSQDDLLLNPPNGDFPPTQIYSSAGRRQSQGDYSWLATVVPGFSTFESNITNPLLPIDTPIGDTNLVRVSIVVFYKRIPTILPGDATTPPSERMVTVNLAPVAPAAFPTGVAGGDVQLSTALAQNDLNLKAGQWIMLSQAPAPATFNPQVPNPPGPNNNIKISSTYWYRWYKVVATGSIQGTTGNWYRNVTLSGPDWNPGTATAPIPTYASICDGVVAVYEKEMELEQTGSPWSPN